MEEEMQQIGSKQQEYKATYKTIIPKFQRH